MLPTVLIIKNPGVFGGGSGGGVAPPSPPSNFDIFADDITTIPSGALAYLTVDSVTGGKAIRTSTGTTFSLASGVLDFASQNPMTFAVVFRQRIYGSVNNYLILDTTNNGTTPGVQILARDDFSVSNGRQLIARVYNGSSWIVDYTARGPAEAYQALIWSVGIITITTTSLTVVIDGYTWLSTTFSAITFPAGAASAAVFGDGPLDLFAFQAWKGGLSNAAALAVTAALQTRFALPYRTILLWDDPNNGETDSAGCTLSDNTFVALATKNPGPGTNIGHIEARTSADGLTWTPDPGSDGSLAGMTLPFTPPGGGGVFDATIQQLSNGTVLAVANQTNLTRVHTLRAANAAAVRSNTWTNETTVTQGTPTLEICASNPTEDPSNPGHVYLCVYRADGAEAFWSCYYYKSTDYGVTWAAPVKFLDGVADSKNYAEPGLQFVTAAAHAKYPDLATGARFFFARVDVDGSMTEVTTSDEVTFTPRTTSLTAFSAARFIFLQDGTMVALIRDVIYQFNTLFRRTGVSGGVAQYTSAPTAPSVVPAFGGQNNGQYGNICKEVTPGTPLIITSTRLDLFQCDTYARFFPTWQLFGQMPLVVLPSSVPAKVTGDTVQFTALGAGNFVWSLHTNASGGSINSSTGLYTAGGVTGTDVVRCTDLNGYFSAAQDISIGVTGSSELPDAANLTFDFDASKTSSVSPSSGSVDSWATQTGGASSATSGGTLKPVYGTSTLNSLKTIDFTGTGVLNTTLPGSGTVAFVDHTVIAVFKMGADISGAQVIWGNALSGIVMRLDSGVPKVVDYTSTPLATSFTDLAVTANTAHVMVFRRTDTAVECWLDGVKSAVTATVTSNAFVVGQTIGNDLSSTAAETFLGYIGQLALWSIAESTGNVTTAMATLKIKWATT